MSLKKSDKEKNKMNSMQQHLKEKTVKMNKKE